MFACGGLKSIGRSLLALPLCVLFSVNILAQDDLKTENELLLELRLDGEALGLDVLAYQRGEDFLLSLDEFASGVGFPIETDTTNGVAVGWFISKSRTFSLNVDNGTVNSDGLDIPILAGEVARFEGDLFVEIKALEKWFPVTLSAVIRQLYLDVEPSEPLPSQLRGNRRDRTISQNTEEKSPQYPLLENPYRLLGPHVTKARLGYSTVRQNEDSAAVYRGNYALLSRGDLGWMTSTIALSGVSGNSLSAASFKLERSAFDGVLGLNHFELGDVDAGGFRGVLLRGDVNNSDSSSRVDNEVVTLQGNQLPDWDVELYQNGQLIMIETTGDDGRYEFKNVPLLFGENRFELKFFGPFGETESREEFHFLGEGMLGAGAVNYQVSAVQDGRTVFGVSEEQNTIDRGSGVFTADLNFGLSQNITISAGVTSRETNQTRSEIASIGLGFSSSLVYGSVTYVDTPLAQNSIGSSLRTKISETNLNLDYTKYFDHVSPETSSRDWQGRIDITSRDLPLPVKMVLDAHEQKNTSEFNASIGTTLRLSRKGQFSTSVRYNSFEDRSAEAAEGFSQTGGQTAFYSQLDPLSFRVSTTYGFFPENKLFGMGSDVGLRIDNNLSLDLGVNKNELTDVTSYSGGFRWQFDQATLTARLGYDSNERWTGLINVSSTIIGRSGTLMPLFDSRVSTSAGSVEVRVYEEVESGERIVSPEVDVKSNQVRRRSSTDEEGKAYLLNMPAYRQVDIEADEYSIGAGDYRLRAGNMSVISRPGSYSIVELPVSKTIELEGHVFVAEGGGTQPVARALVQLKAPDGEVVAQRRTAFDGFFLFDGVVPGEYEIVLEDSLEQRLIKGPDIVNAAAGSEVIQNLDFKLSSAGTTMMAESQPSSSQSLGQESVASTPPVLVPLLAGAEPSETKEVEEQVEAADVKQPVEPSKSVTPAQAETGTWFVQLGAYNSRAPAQEFWNTISATAPLLKGKSAKYAEHGDKIRLLVSPAQGRNDTVNLCKQLSAEGIDCMVRSVD